MNYKEAKEIYYVFTGKSSEIVRMLAFGDCAIVWLFRKGDILAFKWFWSFLPLCLSLLVDLLQYVYTAWKYSTLISKADEEIRKLKKQAIDNKMVLSQQAIDTYQINIPRNINTLTRFLFYLKILVLFVGYITIMLHFIFSVFIYP